MEIIDLLARLCVLSFACIVPVHFHAVWKLHQVIRRERPDWVRGEGSLGVFYEQMPRIANPNVGVDVLRVAFSSRRLELSPEANLYSRRIRVLLPLGLALFAFVLASLLIPRP